MFIKLMNNLEKSHNEPEPSLWVMQPICNEGSKEQWMLLKQ